MKKICFIFCGGTVTMKRNEQGALMPFYDADDVRRLVPQLKDFADISVIKLANVDSSNIDPAFWTVLAKTIHEKKDAYDGFVITHGTDTMAYTASAISFALKGLHKPIVFTGAQKPVEDIPSDASHNLINATLVASRYPVGVAIVFGSKILRGNRATKVSESSLDAFDSPMVPPLGEISLEPAIFTRLSASGKVPRKLQAAFDPNVIVVQVAPGLARFHLRSLLKSNVRGIIFEAFGPGNMPDSLVPFLREAKNQGVTIVVLSQCRKGITRMQLYDVGLQALRAGAIPGFDMTVEAAYAKLTWILAQTRNKNVIRRLFEKSIADEVTIYD